MIETLDKMVKAGVHLGIVSGSDIVKVTEQVGKDLVNDAIYCFSENGLLALKKG